MLSSFMILLALTSLGIEPNEGDDPKNVLDSTLAGYGLSTDQFLTEQACFTIGYNRGMTGERFADDQIPANMVEGKRVVISDLENAIDTGYAIGLEARDVKLSPPASLVYVGWKEAAIKPGQFGAWAATLDLSSGWRLATALTVGSGKNARTIAAGTPVDVLANVEKDGTPSVIVMYDGLPLLVPNPADAPRIISAASAVISAVAPKTRAAKKVAVNADGTPKAVRAPVESGPTLREAIVYVIEGRDGGPGPLQSNGQFAARVRARCVELGIGDRARTFMEHADRHVPYYLNIYKPATDDAGVVTGPGRLAVQEPLIAIVRKVEARRYYLKGEGIADDARYAQIPAETRAAIEAAGDSKMAMPVVAKIAAVTPAA